MDIFLADKLAPVPVVNTNVSSGSYDALTGRYELEGAIMTISKRGTRLFEKFGGEPEEEIFPESSTEFFLKVVDAQITFVKDGSGKAAELILHQNGFDLAATRANDIAEAKVDPAVYDSLVGKYDYGSGAVMMVTCEGTHLFAQLTGQPRYEIFPMSETTYFWKVVDAQVTFVKDADGKVTKAIHHQNGRTFDAPRMKDVVEAKVDPAVYDSLVGKYDYGNGAVMAVTREGNRLFVQLTGQPKLEIFPESETTYFLKVVDAQVTFVKDSSGKVIKVIHHQNGRTFDAPKIQ
jgi:hypothetical protein